MAEIDELLDLERFIKQGNFPTLIELMKKTSRSRNTVLKYINRINEFFESTYPEWEGKKMILNSRKIGEQGYYYADPSYCLKNIIDLKGKSEQDKKRDELVRFLKKMVTEPAKRFLKNKELEIISSIENTESRLDNCKTLGEVLFFYRDACSGLRGQQIARILHSNGCKCFEDFRIEVEQYKKFL